MASTQPTALESIQDLLTQVHASNPFYRAKWHRSDGFEGDFNVPASLEAFAATIPFTHKQELVADQAANPPYGTNHTFPLASYTRCHQTSGTSGKPLRWLDTPQSWGAMVEDWAQVLRAAGVQPGDRILFAFSFGPFLGFWLAFEAAQSLGCLCIPAGGMATALRARVLAENQCQVLCCTPTYALHLAEVAAREGLRDQVRSIRLIVVAGEPGGSQPAVRQRLSDAWHGARVFDHHGMTEVGPVTHELPDRPGVLKILEQSFYAEVVEPATSLPVPEGTPGELVLTTLRRTASPLIRYRTGDIVVARRTAEGLLLEGGILGRVDDMVIVRGVNVYPTAIDGIVRNFPEVTEYRVTLDTRNALPELAVEIEAPDGIAPKLEDAFRESLALRIPVQSVPADSLPRFELKARRWRRL